MSEDEYKFMTLRRMPVRLTVEQVAWLLNCQPHDIQGLVRCRILKPLGNPPQNGKKLYRTKEVLELAEDPAWLHKLTNTIHKVWRDNNKARNGATIEHGASNLTA